jgi:soluble lytic murein transglycosylase-like protein
MIKLTVKLLLIGCALYLGHNNSAVAGKRQLTDEFRKELQSLIQQDQLQSFEDKFEAEVWLVDMGSRIKRLYPNTNENEALKLLKHVHYQAKRLKLNPQLILAIIQIESGFEKYAVSKAGALGLMQIMPFWKAEIGQADDNLFDITKNIRYGCSIFRLYLKQTKGDVGRALARYNGSRGSTKYSNKVFKALREHWLL